MKFIGYILQTESAPHAFPPLQGGLFDYVFTAAGTYVHGKREGLEVCFPIASHEIRGLAPVAEAFSFELPKVPEALLHEVWAVSTNFAAEGLETLFHLIYSPVYPWNNGWELIIPQQTRTGTSCRPLHDGPDSSYERAIIEIHSHHLMPARFSPTDDADEQGFRIFGVIGRLDEDPEIRVRVGLYGYFREIPARWVMKLPAGLKCCIDSEAAEQARRELPNLSPCAGG